MYTYVGRKIDDDTDLIFKIDTDLIIKTESKHKMGDIYCDEWKDIDPFTGEEIHVIYGKYLIYKEY